jgi:hypothetical protein
MKRVLLILVVFISTLSLSCKKELKYGGINGIVQNLFNSQVSFLDVALLKDGNTVKKTTTNIDGKFLFNNIECGDYLVSVNLADIVYYDSVLVTEDPSIDYTFEIAYRTDIWGRAFLPAPYNTVGAPNLFVELMQGSKVLQDTFSDFSGKYTFLNVKQGFYSLRFSGFEMISNPQKILRTINYGFNLDKNNVPIVPEITMIYAP